MKKLRLNYLVIKGMMCLSFMVATQIASAQWVKKASIVAPGSGGGRWGAMTFTINNKIYVAGGYSNGIWFNDVVEYDPATDKWKSKKDLPSSYQNRSAGVTFVINGKAYLGLGAENHLSFTTTPVKLKDLWEYDAANDSWKQKKELPDTGRTEASVFVINNKAYIVGGETTWMGAATNDVWEYDPSADKWTAKSPYIGYGEIYAAAAFTVNNKGYLTGGQNLYNAGLYEYDASNDKWSQKADFPDSARLGPVGFAYNNKGYVGLGNKKGGYQTSFFSYNPANDKWALASTSFPGPARSFARAEVVNGKVYVGAGWKLDGGQQYFQDWYEGDMAAWLGINNTIKNDAVTIFPNPATTELHVKFTGNTKECCFVLYHITGQKISEGQLQDHGKIDVRDLPAGQYIVELATAETSMRHIVSIIK